MLHAFRVRLEGRARVLAVRRLAERCAVRGSRCYLDHRLVPALALVVLPVHQCGRRAGLHLPQKARPPLNVLELPPYAKFAADERHIRELFNMQMDLEECVLW